MYLGNREETFVEADRLSTTESEETFIGGDRVSREIEETFEGDRLSGIEVLLINTHGVWDTTDILVQESESGIPVGDSETDSPEGDYELVSLCLKECLDSFPCAPLCGMQQTLGEEGPPEESEALVVLFEGAAGFVVHQQGVPDEGVSTQKFLTRDTLVL